MSTNNNSLLRYSSFPFNFFIKFYIIYSTNYFVTESIVRFQDRDSKAKGQESWQEVNLLCLDLGTVVCLNCKTSIYVVWRQVRNLFQILFCYSTRIRFWISVLQHAFNGNWWIYSWWCSFRFSFVQCFRMFLNIYFYIFICLIIFL